MSVRNGMEARRAARRMVGESASRKGFATRSCVESVSVAEVVWTCRGRSMSRRAVSRQSTSGIIEKKRSPRVSPQVGSTSASHMKLPANAQTAETNKVAGINTEVAIMTGRTKIRNRSICEYATNALRNVRIVNMGTVCNRVV